MKRALIVLAVFFGATVLSYAQPKAIGGRLGASAFELSYEHNLGGINFIEAEVGLCYTYKSGADPGLLVTGTYNFIIAQPDWTAGTWAWYIGPGVAIGSMPCKEAEGWTNSVFLGIVGQLGLEYTFTFPLQLSADIRPMIGWAGHDLYEQGLTYSWIPCIGVKYSF